MHEINKILNEEKRAALKDREGVFNVALTIAGGALILSLSFVEYFSFKQETVLILKSVWVLLSASIISNILMRYLFTEMRIIEIHKKFFEFENPDKPIKQFFKQYKPERKSAFFGSFFFWIFWVSFVAGLISFLYFAWVNV